MPDHWDYLLPSGGVVMTAALRAAKGWFQNRTDDRQVFSIAGYAGAGKSTIVKYLVDDLGRDEA